MISIFSKPKYYVPNLGQSWLITLVFVIGATLLGYFFLVAISLFIPGMTIKNATTYSLSLTYIVQMIFPIFFIWLMGYNKSKDPMVQPIKIDKPHIGKFNFLTLGLILLFLTLGMGYFLDPVSDLFTMPDTFKEMFAKMKGDYWDTLISAAVMAPLCEEFILRGTMERGMLAHYKPQKAILWSAFIFGLIHLNPWQFFNAFLIGILLGWIYYRTHSIWAVIFIHFVNNFYSVITVKLFPSVDLELTSRENYAAMFGSDIYYWILMIAGGIISSICIYILNKNLPKEPQSFKFENRLIA